MAKNGWILRHVFHMFAVCEFMAKNGWILKYFFHMFTGCKFLMMNRCFKVYFSFMGVWISDKEKGRWFLKFKKMWHLWHLWHLWYILSEIPISCVKWMKNRIPQYSFGVWWDQFKTCDFYLAQFTCSKSDYVILWFQMKTNIKFKFIRPAGLQCF